VIIKLNEIKSVYSPNPFKQTKNNNMKIFRHDNHKIITPLIIGVLSLFFYWVCFSYIEDTSWGGMLVWLFLTLVMTIRFVRQEFIVPARLLIKHIKNESQEIDSPMPKIPQSWVPWFETVSKIFQEKRQLYQQLEVSLSRLEAKNVKLQNENRKKTELLAKSFLQQQTSADMTEPLTNGTNAVKSVKTAVNPQQAKSQFEVLVVDDEKTNRQILIHILSLDKKYTTTEASSGAEALTLIKNGYKPDIILMDVMMPDMTGLEATQKLRKRWQADQLPILLVTAKNQVKDIVAGLEAGANDYLTKPISKDELLAKIQTHLHIKELKTETLRIAREQEEKVRQFLEAVPVGITILDGKGKACYFNQMAQQLLGKDIIAEASHEKLSENYQAYIAGTNQLYPSEKLPIVQALRGESTSVNDVEIHLNDKIIPLEIWGTPIFDEQDNITYAIAAFQDITERKQAEKERIDMTNKLAQLNKAYERFVPRKFLSLLHKKSVIDVHLGEPVKREMTLFFSDIRNFTSISERMTPQDNFNFINAYLSRMEPIIGQHHGVIDKYIGDSIMALFPKNADDAVRAAIEMLKRLAEYNLTRGRPNRPVIRIGIGLNTGILMLGTVGGKNRMDGTVISDAVNLASRVEGLTKTYGAALLITEKTYIKLSDPSQYNIRVIDAVKVSGKSEEVTVYEIFDADPPESIALKEQTLTDFSQGFVLYHCEKFNDARPFFEKVLQVNENDKAAHIYLKRCEYFQKHGDA
jgi:PAS domain S-box-containing protein